MISSEERQEQDDLTNAYMLVLRDIEKKTADMERLPGGSRIVSKMLIEELNLTHQTLVRQMNAYKLLNLNFYAEQIDGTTATN